MPENASNPELFTHREKGGVYEFLGVSHGAGTHRESKVWLYRNPRNGMIFHRTEVDFDRAMEPLELEREEEETALIHFAAEIYQVLGALGAPAHVLDQVSAAANGEPLPYASLLPFTAPRPPAGNPLTIDFTTALRVFGDPDVDLHADQARRCFFAVWALLQHELNEAWEDSAPQTPIESRRPAG